jgi:hypothetical protein
MAKEELSATVTFVSYDGKLMLENFPAGQRKTKTKTKTKTDKCFGVYYS